MLNAIAFFFRPPLGRAVHRNALFSSAYLAKFFLTTFKRNNPARAARIIKENRAALAAHAKIVLADAPGLVPQVARIIQGRYFAKRRLPFILPSKSTNHYYLYYQSEHAPNPDSRVVLHTEKDFFGMPRLLVKISFTDLDVQSVLRTHRLIRDQFKSSGTGELKYDEAELLADVKHEIGEFKLVRASNRHDADVGGSAGRSGGRELPGAWCREPLRSGLLGVSHERPREPDLDTGGVRGPVGGPSAIEIVSRVTLRERSAGKAGRGETNR